MINIAGRILDRYTKRRRSCEESYVYEFCPNCNADLTLQKGYDSSLPYWVCLGCKEMLINPQIDAKAVWICDECGSMLNIQMGFTEDGGKWTCSECGFLNVIDEGRLYLSTDEFDADMANPYRGLSDEDVCKLTKYNELKALSDRGNVILVKDRDNGRLYVKKVLDFYDRSIYEFLKDNPVPHMPKIYDIFESDNCLIVIEEYIEGSSVSDILERGNIKEIRAVQIAMDICGILESLNNLPVPVIHRDIKPSNVMIDEKGDIYLLDINAAKWYNPDKTDDTKYMGTPGFAAPEQAGFGIISSSPKTDIYSLGVMLNVMITGKFPKENMPQQDIGEIISRCISMDINDRYTAKELINELGKIKEKYDRKAD